MYGQQNKWCFVPGCKSTSVSTPHKVFITVPQIYTRKKSWFKAARRDMPKSKSIFFCCEDHFNLEEDMENYVRYKLVGGNIIIKPNVVPYIFDCQPDRKRAATAPERVLPIKRERKRVIEQAIVAEEQRSSELPPDVPSTSGVQYTASVEEEEVSENKDTDHQKSVGVQVRPPYRSKYVQCERKVLLQHTALTVYNTT